MERLAGKKAIITGASSGIGEAISRLFTSEGAHVCLVARNEDPLLKVKDELPSTKKCIAVRCDVSKEGDVKNLVQVIEKEFEGIDILVNNAGIISSNSVVETTLDQWESIIDTNLKGPFLMSKYILPYMIQNGQGSIINISSIIGITGCRGVAAYTAAKGGLILFSKSMAMEYAPNNIRVNSVCPGMVDTPMNKDSKPIRETSLVNTLLKNPIIGRYAQPRVRLWEEVIPLKRVGEPDDIANMVLFLASDESTWVTGSTFTVDGGLTAGLLF